MQASHLPNCLCGTKEWTTEGSAFSPHLRQQSFVCTHCGRPTTFISHDGGSVLLMTTKKVQEFPDVIKTWMDEVMLPTWRDRAERVAKAREPMEERWFDYACVELGLPKGSMPDKLSESERNHWRDFWGLLYKYSRYITPTGFEKPVIPPQLPYELTAYLLTDYLEGENDAEWEKVRSEDSRAQKVPPDPIRVKNDAFFGEVFAALRKDLGHDFKVENVPNEYCGAKCEPWFKFTLGDNTLIVGRRKRVTAIKITSPQGFNTKALQQAAKEVGTTYMPDGRWQGDKPIAKSIEVHAWDKEQLLKFLNIIGKESLPIIFEP